MGLSLGRMLAASLELIETGLGWIEETRDRYVNYLVIWFYLNKEQIWIKIAMVCYLKPMQFGSCLHFRKRVCHKLVYCTCLLATKRLSRGNSLLCAGYMSLDRVIL
nr:PREDICTED: uncharacterized protein LOC108201959 isoform X2 [Daucus carota subsp. sativus]